MNKDKWSSISDWFKRLLKLEEEPGLDEESDDNLQVEERPLSSGNILKINLPEGDLKSRLETRRRRKRIIWTAVVAAVVFTVGGFVLYNKYHTFNDYIIADSIENKVAAGTKYESAGKNIYRYNSDGVSCVSRTNELKWSITYNMQAPIADICGSTMVIAEQQGNQIYVINEDGLIGSFESLLPILKVRVSKQGVVAAVLEDDDVTWVNLYQPDGTQIAGDKTTIPESGYPLDIDISPNGEKLAVSYLSVSEGLMTSTAAFYDFGSSGSTAENHLVGSEEFTAVIMPEIYFTGNSSAAAVTDSGFVVFKGGSMKQTASVTFEEEIVSTFHDDERIGFLFKGDEEHDYRMELYNYRGKRKTSSQINASFDEIRIQNGQILMYGEKSCHVFTMSGVTRFSSAYEKTIEDMFYFSEFRKYLIITRDSFDRIRIS